MKDEPEESERASDAERAADLPGGEVDPRQPVTCATKEAMPQPRAPPKKKDDRGHDGARKDLAPVDRLADERVRVRQQM